jgi:hypothetical protein
MNGRGVKYVFSRLGTCERERGHKKSMNKGEYGRCILYSYIKIEE